MDYDTTRSPSFSHLPGHFTVSIFLKQTLITLDLTNNQIGDTGVKHLVTAFRHNTVTLFSLIFLLISPYPLFHTDTHHTQSRRQWNWSSGSARSGWCITTQHGDPSFPHLPAHFTVSIFLTQTLTALDIRRNQIGPVGAQHLAEALRQNTVTRFFSPSSSFHHIPLLYTDTHHTQSLEQSNRRHRSKTSGWCITAQRGNSLSHLIPHFTISNSSQRGSSH